MAEEMPPSAQIILESAILSSVPERSATRDIDYCLHIVRNTISSKQSRRESAIGRSGAQE